MYIVVDRKVRKFLVGFLWQLCGFFLVFLGYGCFGILYFFYQDFLKKLQVRVGRDESDYYFFQVYYFVDVISFFIFMSYMVSRLVFLGFSYKDWLEFFFFQFEDIG